MEHVRKKRLKGDSVYRCTTRECSTLYAAQSNRNVSSILQRVQRSIVFKGMRSD